MAAGARIWDDSPCPGGHNTPVPLKRSPPGSFKRFLGSAGGRTASPHVVALPWRTPHRAVRAEYAAIAELGPQSLVAPCALVEVNARIGRHRLDPPMAAERTSDSGFLDHEHRRKGRHLPNESRLSCGRSVRRRKTAEWQRRRLASETTQFLATCERPPALSAC